MNRLLKKDSIAEKGTLSQLKIILKRNLPNKVKDDPRAVEDFLELVLDAHLVAAALTYFGMEKVKDIPTQNIDLRFLQSATGDVDKWKYLCTDINGFIEKFIPAFVKQPVDIDVLRDKEKISRKPKKKAHIPPPVNNDEEDYVLNYACSVMGHVLLARNFRDATKEGDGLRTVRCWKFLMVHFRTESSRSKYAIEAFHLLAEINALLSPRLAFELIWNRTVNTRGGAGNNIAFDLHCEHLNRTFKQNVNSFRAHISEKSISRSSQGIAPLQEIVRKFDATTCCKKDSGHHSETDLSRDFDSLAPENSNKL